VRLVDCKMQKRFWLLRNPTVHTVTPFLLCPKPVKRLYHIQFYFHNIFLALWSCRWKENNTIQIFTAMNIFNELRRHIRFRTWFPFVMLSDKTSSIWSEIYIKETRFGGLLLFNYLEVFVNYC
jgi:hypothetical protein